MYPVLHQFVSSVNTVQSVCGTYFALLVKPMRRKHLQDVGLTKRFKRQA